MLSEYERGERIILHAAVESVIEKETKKKSPYILLTLAAEGRIAKCYSWSTTKSRFSAKPKDVVQVEGVVDEYGGAKTLILEKITVVKNPTQSMLRRILPGLSDSDQKLYERTLKKYMTAIQDAQYGVIVKAALMRFWTDFLKAPAASKNHDAFVGGLLKHTVYVTRIACSIAKVYGKMVDMNLLIASALLHDLGKIRTYDIGLATIDYSTQGVLLDHVFHTMSMIDEAMLAEKLEIDSEKMMLVKHVIASHHGLRDWGAINEPSFPEAMIVHLADMADCHVSMMQAAMRDVEPGNLTNEKVWPYGRKLYRRSEPE